MAKIFLRRFRPLPASGHHDHIAQEGPRGMHVMDLVFVRQAKMVT